MDTTEMYPLTMPRTMKHDPMKAKQNIGPASYTFTRATDNLHHYVQRQNSVSKELQSDKQLTLSSLIAADTDDWENADSRQSTRTANDMLHCMYSFHTTDDWVCWTYVCLCVYLTGVQPAGALMNPTTWVCQLDTLPLLIMKKSVNLSLSTTTREIICIGGYYH